MPMYLRIISLVAMIAGEISACVCFYIHGRLSMKQKALRVVYDTLDVCTAALEEKRADRTRDAAQKMKDAGFSEGVMFAAEALKRCGEAHNV